MAFCQIVLIAYVPMVLTQKIPEITGFDEFIEYIKAFGERGIGQMVVLMKNRMEPEEARALTIRFDVLYDGVETQGVWSLAQNTAQSNGNNDN